MFWNLILGDRDKPRLYLKLPILINLYDLSENNENYAMNITTSADI